MSNKIQKPPALPIFNSKDSPGFIYDERSGTKKMYGGKKKDRSLSSMDSWEDKKKEELLWKAVKAGVRFAESNNSKDKK